VQEYLFIAYGCLGFKRRKLGFLQRFSLEKSKINFQPAAGCLKAHTGAPKVERNDVPGAKEHGTSMWAPEADTQVRFLAFSSRFRSFFRLKTPRNLKWIFFTLYRLQQPFKNHWSSISYHWSFTWCLDLLICMIPHYKTLKTHIWLHDLR
jgi:hypothetical protein